MAGTLFLRLGWTDDVSKQQDRMAAVDEMARKLRDDVFPTIGLRDVRIVILAGVDDAFYVPDDDDSYNPPALRGLGTPVGRYLGEDERGLRYEFDPKLVDRAVRESRIGRVERTETGLEIEIETEPGLSDAERGPVFVAGVDDLPPVDSGEDLAP